MAYNRVEDETDRKTHDSCSYLAVLCHTLVNFPSVTLGPRVAQCDELTVSATTKLLQLPLRRVSHQWSRKREKQNFTATDKSHLTGRKKPMNY